MNIVCISDTHGQHHALNLPEGDMILHGGDFTKRGTENQVRDFLNWFSRLPYKYKVFIAGNHDFLAEEEPDLFRFMIPENCIYLEDTAITIEGLKIWGSPYTPWFYDWAFNRHRGAEIQPHWDKIPPDTDILITHGPPAGILDNTFRNEPVGCHDLMKVIQQVKPRFHLFGHIHEGYGMVGKDGTTFINASVLNVQYQLVNAPVSIAC